MSDPNSAVHVAQAIDPSWAEDPLNYLVKAFAAFLQTVFEKAPIGYYHWSPSLEDTEVIVTEENPIALDTVGQRPAISIVLGAVEWNASSLDEFLGMDFASGKQKHTDLLPGMMSLNCCSRVGTEARFLAWQCARHLWSLRRIFMQEPFIHEIGRRIRISPVSPAGALVQGDTEGEWLAASVTCPFYLQWYEQVTPIKDWNGRDMQPLREIEVTYRTRMTQAQENLTHAQTTGVRAWGEQAGPPSRQPKAPRIRGRTIQQEQPGSTSIQLVTKTKV